MIIPFIPSSNILFRVGFVLAERNLYIPSMGFCLICCNSFIKIIKSNKISKSATKVLWLGFGLFILSNGVKSFTRATVWKTEKSLFESGRYVCPKNAKVHYNIAKTFSDNGNFNLAISGYKTAIRFIQFFNRFK